MRNSDVILMCEMTRTLLFSDEPILAKGLESILASVEGFQLTGVCSSTVKLKEILDAGEPDILLIDLTSDVTFSILSELKKASLNCKNRAVGAFDFDGIGAAGDGARRPRNPCARRFPPICWSSACSA